MTPTAFLIHECHQTIQRPLAASLFRLSVPEMENFDKVKRKLPLVFGWIMDEQGNKYVHLPLVPLTAGQMITAPRVEVNNVIIKALNWFHHSLYLNRPDISLIAGLGAYTSVVSKNGFLLRPPGRPYSKKPQLYPGISTISGDTTTAISVEILIRKGCERLNLRNPSLLVIGGTGTVGQRLIQLLVHSGFDKHRIASLSKKSFKACQFTRETGIQTLTWNGGFKSSSISDYDIVVITTSGHLNLTGHDFRSVKLVIDLTMPRFIEGIIRDVPQDTFVVDGGWVQLPKKFFFNGVDIGLPNRQVSYACLAESFMASLAPDQICEESSIKGMMRIKQVFHELGLQAGECIFQLGRLVSWPRSIVIPVQIHQKGPLFDPTVVMR